MVFIGSASVAATASDGSFGRLVFVAAVFGGVVAASMVTLGRISGAFINPAVVVGAVVQGDEEPRDALLYVGAQIAGALAAGLALRAVFVAGPSSAYLGSTSLAPAVDPVAGVAIEAAATFALTLTALWCSRLASAAGQAAIVGAVLFALIVVVGPFTSCSVNPARSLGPALAAGYIDNLWVYVAGPLTGAGLAGAVARRKKNPGR